MYKLVSLLPPQLISWIGKLQFKYPVLGKIIKKLSTRLTNSEGIIKYGIGKGLRFNATGGYPGYLLGTTEAEEQKTFASFLENGGVFYDIGANIGFYTTLAGRLVGSEGQIYAFEPFPDAAEKIRYNASINDYKNIDVFEVAVSKENGEAHFAILERSSQNRLETREDKESTSNNITVDTVRLDDFIQNHALRLPTLVMIDIEGAEFDAIEGMEKTIKTALPVLMVEVHWLIGELHATYEKILKPLGYTIRTLDGQPLPTEPVRYHVIFEPPKN